MITDEIERAIASSIEGARVTANEASTGHFEIRVVSPAFAGKSLLQKQRMVLSPLKTLMAGEGAPVHAIDKIVTLESE
jgi:stress-induced morphogen